MKMTDRHVGALWDAVTFGHYDHPQLDEIMELVRGLADGSLRCADSKTVEELAQLVREPCDSNDRMRARAIVSRWLSTPEQPQR